jgi:ribosomal protein L7Ae-like RNA K-turn-binding protein
MLKDSDNESDIQLESGSDKEDIGMITGIENARKFAKIIDPDRDKVEQMISKVTGLQPLHERSVASITMAQPGTAV